MDIFKRAGGRSHARRKLSTERMIVEAGIADCLDDLVEVDVVGESYRQEALERIAGPKEANGKEQRVGVTIRCEPDNQYDCNAIRVEVMGLHVGYVAKDSAKVMCGPLRQLGGVAEVPGMIVGGWDDGVTEGHFGCRAWMPAELANRLGVTG